MANTKAEIRSGAYYDSVVLMQLQRSLAGLPGVLDALLQRFSSILKVLHFHADCGQSHQRRTGAVGHLGIEVAPVSYTHLPLPTIYPG